MREIFQTRLGGFAGQLCFIAIILSLSFQFGCCHDSASRFMSENNSNQFKADKPTFEWAGFRLNVNYKFSSSIADEIITYAINSDAHCQGGIISSTEIESSLIEVSDNTVRLSLLLNPENIHGARYVKHYENFAVIGVCARLWINRPSSLTDDGVGPTAAPFEDYIIIKADLEDLKGIVDVLDDKSINWGIDAFRCDENNQEIVSPTAMRNGEKLRLCLKPTTRTLDDGVYMGLVRSFRFARDGVVQRAVETYGLDEVTNVECQRGSDLCVIESVLSNKFFHSPGQVTAEGIVYLQYGREANRKQRLLRYVKVDMQPRKSLRTLYDYEYDNGEIVSDKPFSYMVDIEPTFLSYSAEAFPCDRSNNRIVTHSLYEGEHLKLCLKPDEKALDAGVYIKNVVSFSYGLENDDKIQEAVDSYGHAVDENRTQLECASGATICSINSTLEDWFFDEEVRMVVTGYVNLQFGDFVGLADSDLGFAGRSQVDAYFNTVERIIVIEEHPFELWLEELFDGLGLSATHMTILFIALVVLLILVCLCCCAGIVYLYYARTLKPGERNGGSRIPIKVKLQESVTDLHNGSNSSEDDILDIQDDGSNGYPYLERQNAIEEKKDVSKPKSNSSRRKKKKNESDHDRRDILDIQDENAIEEKEDVSKPKSNSKRRRKKKNESDHDRRESENGDGSSSVFLSNSVDEENIASPRENDVCFEAEEHAGTQAFFTAVKETCDNLGPVPYSPSVYKNIKRQLSNRRFYVCERETDDINDDNADEDIDVSYEWRQASKRELIDIFWKHYEEEKLNMLEEHESVNL